MSAKINLTGVKQKTGKLTAIRDVGRNSRDQVMWECECSCGSGILKIVSATDFVSEETKSCGCLHRGSLATKTLRYAANRQGLKIDEKSKYCTKCGKPRLLTEFALSKKHDHIDGRTTQCKYCKKDYNLLRNFRISRAEYDFLLEEQGGGCALCGAVDRNSFLPVDHDHRCCPHRKACRKCIRGLLCNRCNTVLEQLEQCEVLQSDRVKEYLTRRPFADLVLAQTA